jgi:uncharacterized YigZ family protein
MIEDIYKTIRSEAHGIYKDKGSKFLAFAFSVTNEDEVKRCVSDLRKKFHDARHHSFAFRIGHEKIQYRINDDGEPSGTAGKPIYGQILSNNLTDILIVVVRYFGGTLLGKSGLINAYRKAAAECLNNAVIINRTIYKCFTIEFGYEQMNIVMRIIKEESIEINNKVFEKECVMNMSVRQGNFQKVRERMMKIDKLIFQEN